MQQNFTPNQLVQYIYHESSVCETLAIEEMIDENISVREEYESLTTAYRQLPKVKFSLLAKLSAISSSIVSVLR